MRGAAIISQQLTNEKLVVIFRIKPNKKQIIILLLLPLNDISHKERERGVSLTKSGIWF